ncbi:MAG: protein translocase subunit SecF [Halobacteriovoraceae bacterium]|nr:protein translocase subunit SecF [Halobacteriovoraceae bacterium]
MIDFAPKKQFNFASMFGMTSTVSSILVVLSLIALFSNMKYGVDFSGGAEIQVKFNEKVPMGDIRKLMDREGLKGTQVQSIGEANENEVLLKLQGDETNLNQISEQVQQALAKNFSESGANIRKVDIVGPKAGSSLRLSGFQAMAWALIAIMIYIGLRFDFKYSPGAIIALFHDVSIILGIFAITGTEFTLQVVAALLAVIGYSVNDTVIVYDRVREHEQKLPEGKLSDHINLAVNETLSRTILTSGTTLFVSLSMFFFGGQAIRGFFFAITLGVIIGTYSSIFIAAPITLFFDRLKNKSA